MIKFLIGLKEQNNGTVVIIWEDISELDREDFDDIRTEDGFFF